MPKRVVSFALNHQGLGHASRLIAVHTALRERGWDSLFLVEHPQQLIRDHGFVQVSVPAYPDSMVGESPGTASGGDRGLAARSLAAIITSACVRPTDVVLHDVVVYRDLYDWVQRSGRCQLLIHRARVDRPDPAAWVAAQAPDIRRVYVLGDPGHRSIHNGIVVAGVSDVLRRPLHDRTIWRATDVGVRVSISAAGGGHGDAERFLGAALAGVRDFARNTGQEVSVFAISGPYFKGSVRVPPGMPGTVRVRGYLGPSYSIYRDTDLVVCHGGYNTVQELIHTGARAIAVPGSRLFDDQLARLEALAATADVIIADADPTSIAERLVELAARPARPPVVATPPTGAEEIARDIDALDRQPSAAR
jgi:hypothetical protein